MIDNDTIGIAIEVARKKGLPPGTVIDMNGNVPDDPNKGNLTWIPWRISDLNPNDTVQFVPQMVPNIATHFPSVNGKRVLMLDVNGLQALYEVGSLTTTNRFFYNVYLNALNTALGLEELKQHGPSGAFWRTAGYGNGNTWQYTPEAHSFGLTLSGQYLSRAEHYEFDADGIPISLGKISDLVTAGLQAQVPFEKLLMVALKRVPGRVKLYIKNQINKLRRKK